MTIRALRYLLYHSGLNPVLQEKLQFYLKLRYWPNFHQPQTFNEKIHWRRLFSQDQRYIECSDKLAVRDYIKDRIGDEFLIPLLYQGETITPDQLLELGDDIVVKVNHDCLSTKIIRQNSLQTSREICQKINQHLKDDFGQRTRQWWYSKIDRKVLVEKLILDQQGELPFDYKFLTFSQPNGDPKLFLMADFFKHSGIRHTNYYNENGELIEELYDRGFPRLMEKKNIGLPRFKEMVEIAKTLGREFDHVRVDLYHPDNQIYFGELTFAHGEGRRPLNKALDRTMGECWHLDSKSD